MTTGRSSLGWGVRAARSWAAGAVALSAVLLSSPAAGQVIMQDVPEPMQGIAQHNKLGETIPMDVELIRGDGSTVRIGDYIDGTRPVVLALVYYSCPMMCPLMLQRIQEHINALPYIVGEDYRLVVVSFDSREGAELAGAAEAATVLGYKLPANDVIRSGIKFHATRAGQARILADAVGFTYDFDAATGQYAHGSALTVLTGEGKVSRYVDGLAPDSKELRLALLEASEGKIARSIGDLFLHFCYRWDARTGKYTMVAMRVMQVGAVLTLLGVGAMILAMRAGERLRAARRAAGRDGGPGGGLAGVGMGGGAAVGGVS